MFLSSCRPSGLPYQLGLLLPSCLSLAVAFILLVVAPCIRSRYPQSKDESSTWVREYIGLLVIVILFWIAWGFGIPATHPLNRGNLLRTVFQIIFIIGTFLLGIAVFLFFCLLSREAREKWSKLLPCVCKSRRTGYAFTTDNTQLAEENLYMTQYDAKSAEKPTEMETKGVSPPAGVSVDIDVVIPNPVAATAEDGDGTKVDLAMDDTYEDIDKDTKL